MKHAKRNGRIELYRFIFCVFIMLFHVRVCLCEGLPSYKTIKPDFFINGYIGVEFFFVVSGYLMARFVRKQCKIAWKRHRGFRGREYFIFMKKKYFNVFHQHILAFVFCFITYLLLNEITGTDIFVTLYRSLPNLFLVQMIFRNGCTPNAMEWYISSMLIAMVVIYPFLRLFYRKFVRYVAPIAATLLLVIMYYNTDTLSGVGDMMFFAPKANIRAMAEILLGIVCFGIAQWLRRKKFAGWQRLCFTLVEILCLALTVGYVLLTFAGSAEFVILLIMAVMITICFSGVSFGTGSHVFQNKVCYFLGKLSMSLYLTQSGVIWLGQRYFMDASFPFKVFFVVSTNFGVALAVLGLGHLLEKNITGRKRVSNVP